MTYLKLAIITIVISLITACSDQSATLTPLSSNATILAYGDSLTFGTGAAETESYPTVLEQLSTRKVINAGIPGEISQEGLARLPALLAEHKPDLVVLTHGGNDILRRLNKQQLKTNLDNMIALIRQSGAQAMLVGVPEFKFGLNVPELYTELAEQHQLPIEVNVLADILLQPSLKSDQVHPNGSGYRIMAEKIHQKLITAGAL